MHDKYLTHFRKLNSNLNLSISKQYPANIQHASRSVLNKVEGFDR